MRSQILRFTLPSENTISVGTFDELRAAGALSQYFGSSFSMRKAIPKPRHEITLIIQWPGEPEWNTPLRESLGSSPMERSPTSVETDELNYNNLLSALEAPVCEVVVLRFKPDTPVLDDTIRKSVYKSNADCYKMLGFVGGDWGFATNTTLVQGDTTAGAASTSLPPEDQLLSVFVLGWESIEVHFHALQPARFSSLRWSFVLRPLQLHEDATKTALFAEELGELGPHIDGSSGAWYVTLRNHKS